MQTQKYDATYDTATYRTAQEAEVAILDEEENTQEVCALCGNDLYGEPCVTPEGFKTHHTCYAIELTKQQLVSRNSILTYNKPVSRNSIPTYLKP